MEDVMSETVELNRNAKDTYDGQPRYDVVVDGVLVGEVVRYTENVNHSVNNVLVRVTKRHGWRCELKLSATDQAALGTVELRQRARRIASPRITWETRKRAVAELLSAREAIARLAS
jgi:hypothetical protein